MSDMPVLETSANLELQLVLLGFFANKIKARMKAET
jgi:hypothetical protein